MSVNLPSGSIDDSIYTGFWINRSFGVLRGATLTLDRWSGGLLIAFLALYVGATGRGIWTITRFLLHFIFSTELNRDGVYHQRQAILRNAPLAQDAVWELLRIAFVWRKRTEAARRRILPAAVLAALISVASVVAGIFSPTAVTNTMNEALVSGQSCGILPLDDTPTTDMASVMTYQSQKSIEFITYAMQCYREGGVPRPQGCDIFTKSALPYTSDTNASCPFAKEMCQSSTGNLLLDSGDLDSFDHLGFNTGPRFLLRHQTHCAPLNTLNFTEIHTDTQDSSKRFMRYKYGSKANRTFLFQAELDREKPRSDNVAIGNYKVMPFWASHLDSNCNIIPQLNRSDAMVSLLFLDASDIIYFIKTEDPWFSATTPATPEGFYPDEPLGVLGCVTHRLYCNPDLPNTTGCVNAYAQDVEDALSKAWPNSQDESAIRPVLSALSTQGAGLMDIFYALPGIPTLLCRNTLLGNVQTAALPDNQWQIEREHIYKASMAALQSIVVDYAKGDWFGPGRFCGAETSCRRICNSQKVRSQSHYSFSVWVLALILSVGGLIMFLSTILEQTIAFVSKLPNLQRNRKITYGHAEWQANSTLQLQRLAHEGLGLGTWSRTDESVPVTELGDTLGVLDVSDRKHPRLVPPSVEMVNMGAVGWQVGSKARPRYTEIPSVEQI